MLTPLYRYRWVILALTCVAQLSNALAAQSVAPLAPIFQPELGISRVEVGFFSTAAFAGAWVTLLVAGSLTDRFGIRRMMSFGQVITGLLVLSMSVVGSFPQAVLVMFLAGLGRGATAPGVTKGVVDWFPPRARATGLGFNQAMVPLAGMFAASVLPALALTNGWRAAVAVVGFAILAGSIATALFYRDSSSSAPIRPRAASPRASLREVFKNRNLWVVALLGPVFGGIMLSVITYLALYFKEVVLLTSFPEDSSRIVAAGAFLAVYQAGGMFARMFWGVVSDRLFRGRRMVVLAMVAASSGLMTLTMGFLGTDFPVWLLALLAFACGAATVGWGGLYLTAAAEMAGPRYAATGVGFCMTAMQMGNVGGPPIFGFIVDTTGSYRAGWLLLFGLSIVAALTCAWLSRREKHPA